MPKMVITSIKDQKTGLFGPLQTHFHLIEASRLLQDIVDRGNSPIAKHPHDFYLYHVANFETETGVMSALENPVPIISALDVAKELGVTQEPTVNPKPRCR